MIVRNNVFKADHTSTFFAVAVVTSARWFRSAPRTVAPGFARISPPQWEEVKHEARSSATVLAKYQENTQERDFREALELASQLLNQRERAPGVNLGRKAEESH